MTESMLKSLMKLYALLASINLDAARIFSRNFVESYLKGEFSPKLVERSITIYDQYLAELEPFRNHPPQKRITSLSVKILIICNEINGELHLRRKYLIIFSIIQFARHYEAHSASIEEFRETVLDAIVTIAEALMINEAEFNNCRTFINDKFYKVPDRASLLVVSGISSFQFSDIKHLQKEHLTGQFFFLKIYQADLYIFYYTGNEIMELGGKNIFPNHIYVFPKGASIKSEHISPIYYGDIVSAFRRGTKSARLSLQADRIDFRYNNSDNGIHELNLSFETGEMVGVMGGSGTGKSTLMGILNGTIIPDSGTVLLNGKPLDVNGKGHEGLIGFVPQDDLLIEELTVFENLYYNAKLCLGDMGEKEIIKRIGRVLNSLGLFYIKDLKVGNPLNKYISGGQRKRLNIALELIREPQVLFVDEPTSGLSSTDSENVLYLLKEQALTGKIVVVNIHQPSSDMFKLFDKVVIMDKAGYPVYTGNPLDSVSYIKKAAERADAAEIQCETCGNVQTEDILKIIEAKKVNEFGEYTKERLLEPQDWYALFKEKVEKPIEITVDQELPEQEFRVPSLVRQFWIYTKRNFFSKLADTQFVLLALTITPALALILGFFTKYLGDIHDGMPAYVFSMNENLPAYLFMSVIVALFVGLIISAEEIIKDRKIRAREAFLHLNKYAYFNSKILFLIGLSAFQILAFVFIGNGILGIKGMTGPYWIILFSTSCFAVMLGLNISSGLKSIISIYINIPFILVPLILLSGVIVNYDKLHPKVAGIENVPIVGDIMASRWAYEALVVTQFKDNAFETHFFELDKEMANAQYQINFHIPELKNRIQDMEDLMEKGESESAKQVADLLFHSFHAFEGVPRELDEITPEIDDVLLMRKYLDQWRHYLISRYTVISREKDSLVNHLEEVYAGVGGLAWLKQRYHNESVEELALNNNELRKVIEYKGRLVRKDTPVFQIPVSRNGRAQFFTAEKQLGNSTIDTLWFNIAVLWLMTLILYIALVNDWLRKIIGTLKLHRGKRRL